MPSQVQPNGESNGLSVESLNLDVNGAQSAGHITTESVKPLRPKHYTHPSTINNGHVDSLSVFIDDINHALSGALSRDGILYKKVSVLFLRWEDDVFIDPGRNNGVQATIPSEAYKERFSTFKKFMPAETSSLWFTMAVMVSLTEWIRVFGHKAETAHPWIGFQFSIYWSILEYAVPDVLILLDCCFAASADQRSVDGTVEILAACGHETETVGISDWSFTNRLTEIMRDMKDQTFTVAQLHSKLVNYRAVKGPKRLMRTPHHRIMSNKDKASIRISALKRNSAINRLDDLDLSLSEGSEQSDSISPRVLIAVSMQGDLDTTSWRDWLLSQLPTGIEGLSLIRPEGIFRSHSVLGVFSLPVALWDLLPERSAYKFVSFITTPNLITQITDSSHQSTGNSADVHTALVSSQPLKLLNSSPPSAFLSVDSKKTTPTLSGRTLLSAHNDTIVPGFNDPDPPISFPTVIQLYSEVKSSFEWHSESYQLPDSWSHINTCFWIEGKRFQLWAGLWHLDQVQLPKAILTVQNFAILKFFGLILHDMRDLFHGISGMPQSPSDDVNESQDNPGPPPRKPLRKMLDLFHRTRRMPHPPSGPGSSAAPHDVHEIQTDVKTTETPFDLGRPRRKPVQLVVKQLSHCNDCLEQFSTPFERMSLRYSLRTSCVCEKVSRLTDIQDAAAILGHKDIQQWTKARVLIEQEWDKQDESAAFFRIDENKMRYRGLDDRWLRSSALYKGQEVLVDWYDFEPRLERTNGVKQIANKPISSFLSQDLSPLDLPILQCVGYIERLEGGIGYAFAVPRDSTQIQLDHLIRPMRTPHTFQRDLDDRFKLANALATTIFGMHTLRWSHGDVSLRNIIFLSQDQRVGADLCQPYLLGFGLGRHFVTSRYEVLYKKSGNHEDFKFYRHPELRKSLKMDETRRTTATHAFKPSYDMYSLGIVLYEIGVWHLLQQSIVLERRNSRRILTDAAIGYLEGYTGHRYTEVVIACLDGSFDEIWEASIDDDPRQLSNHLREFQKKIVDPLAACSA